CPVALTKMNRSLRCHCVESTPLARSHRQPQMTPPSSSRTVPLRASEAVQTRACDKSNCATGYADSCKSGTDRKLACAFRTRIHTTTYGHASDVHRARLPSSDLFFGREDS